MCAYKGEYFQQQRQRRATLCFPAVLFGCFQHCGDPPLARCFVFPKLTFNQETSQLLFVLCSVHHFLSSHLSADSQRNDSAVSISTAYSYFIWSTFSFVYTIKHRRYMQANMQTSFHASLVWLIIVLIISDNHHAVWPSRTFFHGRLIQCSVFSMHALCLIAL